MKCEWNLFVGSLLMLSVSTILFRYPGSMAINGTDKNVRV